MYAKSHIKLKSLWHSVKIFGTDICMAFSSEKYKTLSVARGKFFEGIGISLLTGQIQHLMLGNCIVICEYWRQKLCIMIQ